MWLPDRLRKVWVAFVQSETKSAHAKAKFKRVWDYPNLKLWIVVPDINQIEQMKNTKTTAYLDILRRAQRRVLEEKHVRRFTEQHQLSQEAKLLENIDWRQLLRDALEKPAERGPQFSILWPYSVRNQVLLLYQMKIRGLLVTPVKSRSAWKAEGNPVAQGEKGLYALTPDLPPGTQKSLTRGVLDTDEEDFVRRFVMLPNYFCYGQTEQGRQNERGWVSPELPNFDAQRCMRELNIAYIQFEDEEIDPGNLEAFLYGYATKYPSDGRNVLAVRPGMPDGITTFFHEMGHIVLGHIDRVTPHDDRGDPEELQAESVALLCLHALGMSSFEESSAYIQGWWDSSDYPEDYAEAVFNASNKILKAGMK